MKSSVTNLEATKVELTVEVPFEELEPAMQAAYKRIAGQISVPGFRKGKVPPRIIDQRLGRGAVIQEAVNDALPEFYATAAQEHGLRPMGRPQADLKELPLTADDTLIFTVTVEVRPDIELPELGSLEIEVGTSEITQSDIDERLDALRERFGTLKTVERPARDGDFVVLDLKAEIDGKEIDSVAGISYQIGSGNMLDGLDEALTDLSAGETTTFDAPLAGGEHEGESSLITVTATSVKERELPVADDDFAQLASEFDTLDELRDDLRGQVVSARRANQAREAQSALLDLLLERVEVPVPAGVLADEVQEHLEREGRLDDDEHRVEATSEAERTIRTQLLLDELATALEVGVTQSDLVQFMIQTSQQYGMDPQQFISMASESGQLNLFAGEIRQSKALVEALRRVIVKDAEGNALDMVEILGTGEELAESDEVIDEELDEAEELEDDADDAEVSGKDRA